MQEKLKTSETATRLTEAAIETLLRLFGLPVGQRVEMENWDRVLTKEFEGIVEKCDEWGRYLDFKDWDLKINVFPPIDFDASKVSQLEKPRASLFLIHCASMMKKTYDKRSEAFGLEVGKSLAVGLIEIQEENLKDRQERVRAWGGESDQLSQSKKCQYEAEMLRLAMQPKNDDRIAIKYFDTRPEVPITNDVWSFSMKKSVLDGFGQHLKHDFNKRISGEKDPFDFASEEYDWRKTSARCLIDYITTESRKEKESNSVVNGEKDVGATRRSSASR
jgi:hypothetical protein